MKKVLSTIFNLILCFILICCIGLYVAFNFWGYSMYIVMSGSMEPTINVDDLVIIKTVSIDDVKENDIITYKDNGSYITHRVVGISNEDGLIKLTMQGDNNNVIDKVKVTSDTLQGKYLTHISNGGTILEFIHSPVGTTILVSIPVALFLIWCLYTFVFKTGVDSVDTVEPEIENKEETKKK